MSKTLTLTRKQARMLVDLIPEEPDPEGVVTELVTALDIAQGNAGDDGTDTVTIVITGEPL